MNFFKSEGGEFRMICTERFINLDTVASPLTYNDLL